MVLEHIDGVDGENGSNRVPIQKQEEQQVISQLHS
jgi:hypothetical protein